MDKNKKKESFENLIILFCLITFIWIVSPIFLKYITPIFSHILSYINLENWKLEKLAQLGDSFGGINALFSGLAFAGMIYTILLQRKELSLQRTELQLTRETLDEQKDELKKTAEAQELLAQAQIESTQAQKKSAQAQEKLILAQNLQNSLQITQNNALENSANAQIELAKSQSEQNQYLENSINAQHQQNNELANSARAQMILSQAQYEQNNVLSDTALYQKKSAEAQIKLAESQNKQNEELKASTQAIIFQANTFKENIKIQKQQIDIMQETLKAQQEYGKILRMQTEANHKPDISYQPSSFTIFGHFINSDVEITSIQKSTNTPEENRAKIDFFSSFTSNISNIGVGVAKNIQIKWIVDLELIEKILLKYENKKPFEYDGDFLSLRIKHFHDLINISQYNHQKIEFILPYSHSLNNFEIEIPPYYMQLYIQHISNCYKNNELFKTEFPTITLKIIFEDILGKEYEKETSFNIKSSYITHPQSRNKETKLFNIILTKAT